MADELVTVRIPELPENPMPTGEDRIPIWVSATNKTNYASLATLSQYFALGGGATVPPNAADKGRYVFDITQAQIDAGGGNTIYLPEFAGKNCLLTIDGRPFKDAEYDVLSAGGFTVTIPGYKFQEGGGQRVVLDFAEKIKDTSDGSSSTTSGGFITGKMVVSVNTTMTKSDAGKLVQIRAGSASISLSIPDLAQMPVNSIIPIETAISNQKQATIQTVNGQFIYMNGTSFDKLYMGGGEALWLFRDTDGYYVINDFGQIYKNLAKPVAAYEVGTDEIKLDGSLYAKADHQRLWAKIQALGQSIVDESTWQSSTIYRGCWSRGTESHFRAPNLMGQALVGLSTTADRDHNYPGGWQDDGVGDHTHAYRDRYFSENGNSLPSSPNKELVPNGNYNANKGASGLDSDNNYFLYYDTATGSNNAGAKNTIENVGVYWVCKK